jgi:hypothetical protein
VTGDEHDIEAMLSDPVSDLARAMDRLIARQGPLLPETAVHMTREIAQAVMDAADARRYAVTGTHVLWLGSVLFFALTGKAPLAPRPGETAPLLPPPVGKLCPYPVHPDIEAIVARCLSPHRRDRYRSVRELDRALASLPEAAFEIEEDDRCTIPPASGVTLSRGAASAPGADLRAAGGAPAV